MSTACEKICLGRLYEIKMGKTPPRDEAKYWDKEKRTNNLWVSIADLSINEGKTIKDTKEYISDIATQNIRLVPKGSLLISFKLSLGKMAFAGENLYTNEAIIHLEPKENVNLMFLYYYFSFLDWNSLAAGNDKVKGKTLNKKILADIPVIYPPLSEQERIVKILDAAFEKIDRLKQNAEKGLQEVKNLWQATLKEELKPKEGWNLYTLKDIIADISYGTSVPSCENGEYVYLRMNNITNDGRLDLKGSKTITLTEKELEKCIVRKGDILFNRTNSMELVGKSCVFDQDDSMVIAGYIIRIRLQKEYDPQFVSYSMNYMRSLGLFRNLIVGAVHQANISAKAIQTIRFSIPSLEKQQSIASKFDDIFDKCRLLRENYLQEIDKYESLKQSILRKAFSGEL